MLGGCAGPEAMRVARTQYNEAIHDTAKEQLLLNLVRLKYRESVFFLEVNSVATSYKFDASGTLQATSPWRVTPRASGTQGGSHVASITGLYDENPTFSYAPVQGEEFTRRLIGEISIKTLVAILRSGWAVDVVMRIAVDRIGDGNNSHADPNAAGEFRELCSLWRKLQKRGDLSISTGTEEEKPVVTNIYRMDVNPDMVISAALAGYHFKAQARDGNYFEMTKTETDTVVLEARYNQDEANEVLRFDKLLGCEAPPSDGPIIRRMRLTEFKGLQFGQPRHKLADASEVHKVPIRTRSFKDVLLYLAQGIEVPAGDARKVWHYDPSVWARYTNDLLDVRCSLLPPVNAYVSVFYRGAWFYISDDVSDTPDPKEGQYKLSKDNFALLALIYALQAGEVKGSSPVLTIPVSK
jgi:hypothetical protein